MRLHAALFLTDQIADGPPIVAEGHNAGWAGVDAKLMFQRHGPQVIPVPTGPVVVHQEFRNDKQRNPFCTGRCPRHPGQNHVNDVVGVVVIAIGDENLGAGDAVVIAVLLGFGIERADIGTGLGFGQAHGARPLTGHQLAEKSRLLLRRAELQQ